MPKSIVGDPDVLFTNNFWKELFKLTGTKLPFPSAFIINRMDRQRRSITQLKCIFDVLWRISHGVGLIGYHGRNFVITLPFTQHFTQPHSRSFMVGTTTVVVLCTRLFTGRSYWCGTNGKRSGFGWDLSPHTASSIPYEATYDKGHHDVSFKPNDWVWHRLSILKQKGHKLLPWYYGPFHVLHKIGNVVYQLILPPSSKIHNVFHVSLLKPFKCELPTIAFHDWGTCHSPSWTNIARLQEP